MKAILSFLVVIVTVGGVGPGTVSAETHYVVLDNPTAASPYTNWATAAANIQQAIDVAAPQDEVVVTNGVYASGSRAVGWYQGNRVAVTKPLTLRSVNGPTVTIIDAGGAQARSVDVNSTNRCVYLADGATLSGFTLTNAWVECGGGVLCVSSNAMITNCVLTGNSARYSAGGAQAGILFNCVLTGNSAESGGGVASSILWNCQLTGNSSLNGGAALGSTCHNCTLVGNTGGGTSSSALFNCIAYFNTAGGGANYDPNCTLNYCCTTPLPDNGPGNIESDPLFVNLAEGDLRLLSNSPCIDAGNNVYVTSHTDLDGKPRISEGTVDIGAFEFQMSTSPLITTQPRSQTVPPNSSLSLTVVASAPSRFTTNGSVTASI